MLVLLVYPIADLRYFIKDELGRLPKPTWNAIQADHDFLRSLGPIRERLLGGGNSFLREGFFCLCKNVLRSFDCQSKTRKQWQNSLVRVFRRYYFDGCASGKLEVGFLFNTHRLRRLHVDNVFELLYKLFQLQSVLHPRLMTEVAVLKELGPKFAFLYQKCTTRFSHVHDLSVDRLVFSAAPIVFVQVDKYENFQLPPRHERLHLAGSPNYELYHSRIAVVGGNVRAWTIRSFDRQMTRLLRMYMIRLYIEHQVLRQVVRNVPGSYFKHKALVDNDRVSRYLNKTTRFIANMDHKFTGIMGHEMGTISRQAEDHIRPGDIAQVLEYADEVDFRPNIKKKITTHMNRDIDANESTSREGISYMAEKQEFYYGGIVGRKVEGQTINFQQLWMQSAQGVDFEKLFGELGALRSAMRAEATTSERDISTGAVAAAEIAASKHDGPAVLEALSKAGQWALDVATKIGVNLASEMLKKSLQ